MEEKTFTIEGHEIKFIACTAIAASAGETIRQPAIFVTDSEDRFGNCDGVIFFDILPETESEAISLLEDYIDTNYETLDTVEIDGRPLSDYVLR